MTRYNNIDYVLEMQWIDGLKLINKAMEKQIEQREWDMWISLYPNMDKNNYISFEKFRAKIQVKTHSKNQGKHELTVKEIIENAEEIRKLHQGTHEGVKK